MVKIVLAGGAGNVGREVLDALAEKGTHELTVFTRSEAPDLVKQGINVVKVDYSDKASLAKHLQGVDVVLSFVVTMTDPEGTAQKNLIDASIEAGVKRFAPSEWATQSNSGAVGYASKDIVHEYLQKINAEKRVLEYSLFQPGLFLDYLSVPYRSSKHMHVFKVQWDLENRRAIVPAEGDFKVTLTTVGDMARLVVAAIDYEGIWPERGGISGNELTNSEVVKLAEAVRGPFQIEKVSTEDLRAGKLNTSWVPEVDHPSLPPEYRTKAASEGMIAAILAKALDEVWLVTDEWNKLLPDFKFTKADEFLSKVWDGKP